MCMFRILLIWFIVGSGEFIMAQSNDVSKTVKDIDLSEYDTDLLNPQFHKQRRDSLRKLMPANTVAVFFANPIRNRSNDVDYEYHQDPNFYYLTGLNEPNAVLIISKSRTVFGNEICDEIIFVQDRDPATEVWNGRRLGIDGVKNKLGFSAVYQNRSFQDFIFDFFRFDKVLITTQFNDARDDKNERGDIFSMTKHFNYLTDSLNKKVNRFLLGELMAKLRMIKTPEEIHLLRKACQITCEAQIELMKNIKPGMTEYQTEAIIEYVFASSGAESEGFPSIQGGGHNSCILHYNTNRKTLKSGELLVSDIGAEYHGYTADVSRTIPVNGKFNKEQTIIYNLVLKAQEAGIQLCKIGNKFWDPHNEATRIIAAGLLELGIIKKESDVKKYFLHGTSHYLGLDVHDPGLYTSFTENQVITVEPGIYIPEGSDCDPKWWNIGVRIEDDILITKNGPENLSVCVPRTIDEIERLMVQAGKYIIPKK